MHKELVFLKGYAKGKKYFSLMEAVNTAVMLHDGQFRKSGEQYVEHPMRVASSLVSLGIDDEATLIIAMLHDVLEDCDVTEIDLEHKFNVDKEQIEDLKALSKCKGVNTDVYYKGVRDRGIRTILCKISDRCHNVSSMAGAFSIEKMKSYVKETEDYVLPLCKYAKTHYPQYSDPIFAMRYFIESINKTVKALISVIEAGDTSSPLNETKNIINAAKTAIEKFKETQKELSDRFEESNDVGFVKLQCKVLNNQVNILLDLIEEQLSKISC